MEDNKKLPQTPNKLFCNKCNYYCSHKGDWNKHIRTAKHLNYKNDNNIIPKTPQFYKCHCGNEYNHMSGLSRHRKKCYKLQNTQIVDELNNQLNNENKQQQLIEYLMKENHEFKQLMIEQNKQMIELSKNSGNNNNNTTNNNNNFNLNFFLNETCKNAMNIMDFVNQLPVGSKDLEETGRLGFAEGISKIFINGLKQIDINDRPVHCSDSKRETLYIKDNNQWNKENEDKIILTNALKHVAHKNMKQISEWTKDHPEYNDYDSKQNDKYLKIVSEAMSGSSKEETNKNYNKIIKNIAKETIIDKDKLYIT
jgi:hypothetical protein